MMIKQYTSADMAHDYIKILVFITAHHILACYFVLHLVVLKTVLIQGREKEADQRRRILAEGSKSDHIMLANAFQVSYVCMIIYTHRCLISLNFLLLNIVTVTLTLATLSSK